MQTWPVIFLCSPILTCCTGLSLKHSFSEVPKLTDNCVFWLLTILLNYQDKKTSQPLKVTY